MHPMVISQIGMTPGGVARSGNMGQGAPEAPEGAYNETPHRKPVRIILSRLHAPMPQEMTLRSRCALQCEVVDRPVKCGASPASS